MASKQGLRGFWQPFTIVQGDTRRNPLVSMTIFRFGKYTLLLFAIMFVVVFSMYYFEVPCLVTRPLTSPKYAVNPSSKNYNYDNNMPLIFIGGMPRSGTTLLRVLLDAHPDIRCGEETRVIPDLLITRNRWTKSSNESKRLEAAGITGQVINSAMTAFILEVIARHGAPAPRLCNKDPFTMMSAVYIHSLFPNAKFIFVIRDGRAVVHSIITRKVVVLGFNITDYKQCLQKWNLAMETMYNECLQLSSNYCLPVYYEQLVLHPKRWMEKILKFLDVPWNDAVMHHDQFVDKPGGISLSKLESSTDQVIKPINVEALSTWVGKIPEDVVIDMHNVAPMLSVLGYDPYENPPNYGKPDFFVISNTKQIDEHRDIWESRQKKLREEKEAIILRNKTDAHKDEKRR